MQPLKKIITNRLIVVCLALGMTISAIAADDMNFVRAEAERGNVEAQAKLGASYFLGINGLNQDYNKSYYWNKKAADQGHTYGEYAIGVNYLRGQGVRQDYQKAIYWLKKGADKNSEKSQYTIGSMYLNGQGVRQNIATSKEWFGKSCDNGSQGGCDIYRILNEQGY